jgi:hypothetical protein
MIDIVIIAQTILQMHVIVNGSQNIFLGNMLGYQFMYILLDRFCQAAQDQTVGDSAASVIISAGNT